MGGSREVEGALQVEDVVLAEACRIPFHTPLPQRDSNGGRQILIEVELHARRVIASCMARPSA